MKAAPLAALLMAIALLLPARARAAASTELDDAVYVVRTSKDPAKRLKAVQKLGELKDSRSVAYLIDALHPMTSDPRDDWFVRTACVTSLVRIGAPAVDPLRKAVTDPSPIVRARVLEALTKLRAPGVVELLAKRLKNDPEVEVRIACVAEMRDLGDKAALPPLREAAQRDQSPIVRERAASIADKLAAGS